MTTLDINLTGFDSDLASQWYGYGRRNPNPPRYKLSRSEEAKRAVKEYGITRQCGKVDTLLIEIPDRVEGIDDQFLMHLLGPAARKLTPSVLESKLALRIHGQTYNVKDSLHPMAISIRSYLSEEEHKIAKRAKAKAEKKPENIVWGEPTGLFIPDIGTKLKTVLPWNFTLFGEYRNSGFIELITDESQPRYYRGRDRVTWQVQVLPESILIVDRVYIRKGAGFEDFSSLTFRIAKGSEVVYDDKTIKIKSNKRFWAKLRDVNTMLVEVDLNSLPGQEKEGTARK